ncbi:unnamed protein product [Chilo suppressalis]|uniref:MADF domain-containing protein n=1 Tax=Chilo suppressalis TaxID=168631 RepID=A0ABN8B0X5_CHISP|nr:unnamed protein product [Chilo suppressalis]
MSDDIEHFIELVRGKPFLYDLSDEGYKNRQKKANAWTEIAQEMGRENSDYWSSKWKTLKDNYNKVKKTKQTSTGQSYKKYRNWPWAELMRFLDDVSYQRTPASNINLLSPNTTQNSDSVSNPSEDISLDEVEHNRTPSFQNAIFEDTENSRDSESQNSESSRASSSHGPIWSERLQLRRQIISPETQAVLDYIKKKESQVNKKSYDEVDLFFLSYAQNFKRLPRRSQALLKMDIAGLFTRYELQNENCNTENMAVQSNPSVSSDHNPSIQTLTRPDDRARDYYEAVSQSILVTGDYTNDSTEFNL